MPLKSAKPALLTLLAMVFLGTTAPAATQTSDPVQKADKSIAPSAHMTFEELVGDNGDYDAPPSNFPGSDTYRIVVDKGNKIMTIYNKADSSIQRQMLCTIGKPSTPSPRGKMKMGKGRVRFGFFEEFNCYAQYWVQVTRNVYMHSVLYSKKSVKSLIKASYRDLGKAVSHGCIRLAVPDARWIYENIAPGTEIEFVNGKRDKALKESLKLPEMPKAKPKAKAKAKK